MFCAPQQSQKDNEVGEPDLHPSIKKVGHPKEEIQGEVLYFL